MYNPEIIEQIIAKALPGASVQVRDTTGTNDHFEARVSWAGFAGKGLLEQHQMVMASLKEALKGPIHAITIKTKVMTNKEAP